MNVIVVVKIDSNILDSVYCYPNTTEGYNSAKKKFVELVKEAYPGISDLKLDRALENGYFQRNNRSSVWIEESENG